MFNMDSSFTEHVLERARERQKKLAPLREHNNPVGSTPNLTDSSKVSKIRKTVVSDPMLSESPTFEAAIRENRSDSNIHKMLRQNSKTRVSSNLPGSPQPQLKTLNIQRDNFNMEIKLTSSDNVRVEVEIDEEDSDNDVHDNEDKPVISDQVKNRLQRLGQLYGDGDDLSSPISRTEAKFQINDESGHTSRSDRRSAKENDETTSNSSKPRRGLGKLADLAHDINQWEDNISTSRKAIPEKKSTTPKKSWKAAPAPQPPISKSNSNSPARPVYRNKAPAPQPPKNTSPAPKVVAAIVNSNTNTPTSPRKFGAEGNPRGTPKQLKWDQSVLDSLESQGFTRTDSNSRLVYNYKNSQDKQTGNYELEIERIVEEEPQVLKQDESTTKITKKQFVPLNIVNEEQKTTPRSPSKRVNAISSKAALFESAQSSPSKKEKDPALLSISERMALFEKNKGTALVPKAAFGMAPPRIKIERKAQFPQSSSTPDNLNDIVASKIVSKVTKLDKLKSIKSKSVDSDSVSRTSVDSGSNIADKIARLNNHKSTISQEQIENKVKEERQKEMDVLLNRFHKKDAIEPDSESENSEDENGVTTALISSKPAKIVGVHRSSSGLPAPPVTPGEARSSGEKRQKKADSPQVQAALGDVKRIKVAAPKDGQLYPCLSDIEANTETEPEPTISPSPNDSLSLEDESFSYSDGANTSFGRDILQTVCKNQSPQKRVVESSSSSSAASDVTDVLEDMDEYLNEFDQDTDSLGPTPPKHGKLVSPQKRGSTTQPSESFNYKSYSPRKTAVQNSPRKGQQQKASPGGGGGGRFRSPVNIVTSPNSRRLAGDLPTHVVDGEDVLPLTHTVSFYRKQQQASLTPIRHVTREQFDEEAAEEINEEAVAVAAKIKQLANELNIQQRFISQTSQALNLCNATPEFTGSTEQVEAEKLLLLATHRKRAVSLEMERLKVEGTLRPVGQRTQTVPLEKGTLTVSNISLPLKKDYVRALTAAGGKGHHVVCLIKSGEQVVTTQLVSTVVANPKNPDLELIVPGQVKLENIYSDFTVTFEVYCLQAQEEILPHDVKYHINKKSSRLTPKKSKQDSRMTRPPKESPAGPQAVRSPTFALMGYSVFSIQAVNKKHFTLNQAPPMSPLEGSVEMRVNCELAISVEHRGFLNMFEDVSGTNAWHRRWCLLQGNTISYWKYPEDERKKAPISTLDLKSFFTKKVELISRDLCARAHTFLLERERPAQLNDQETFTVLCRGDKTVIRHLLAADSKEERIEWCNVLNKSLTALRMWGNNSKTD